MYTHTHTLSLSLSLTHTHIDTHTQGYREVLGDVLLSGVRPAGVLFHPLATNSGWKLHVNHVFPLRKATVTRLRAHELYHTAYSNTFSNHYSCHLFRRGTGRGLVCGSLLVTDTHLVQVREVKWMCCLECVHLCRPVTACSAAVNWAIISKFVKDWVIVFILVWVRFWLAH